MSVEPAFEPEPGKPQPAPSLGLGPSFYLVGLLGIVSALNFVDRQVVSILAQSIKRELHLADWQLGAVTGLSFALLYSVCALPIARLAQRHSRPVIIGVALAVWSAFTALGGLSRTFVHLALARLGVGLGEAGMGPAVFSLISDRLPPHRRALGQGIVIAGSMLGVLIGMALGGFVADRYGWRAALFVAGLPGLPVALLVVATLRDPLRTRAASSSTDTAFLTDAARLFRNRSFVLICLGGGCAAFVSFVHAAFYPALLLRTQGAELPAAAVSLLGPGASRLGPLTFLGLAVGAMAGGLGFIGSALGGWVGDLWAKRSLSGYMRLPALVFLLAGPLAVATFLAPHLESSLAWFGATELARSLATACIFSSVHWLVSERRRPTASAFLFLFINLVGLGIGPIAVGGLSDVFAAHGLGPGEGLRRALLCAEGVGLVGSVLFAFASVTLPRDAAKASD